MKAPRPNDEEWGIPWWRHFELVYNYLRGEPLDPNDYDDMSPLQKEYFKDINRYRSRLKRKYDIEL